MISEPAQPDYDHNAASSSDFVVANHILIPRPIAKSNDNTDYADHIERGMMQMTQIQLRELCVKHGIPKHGSKLQMIARLREKLQIRMR